MKPYDYLVVGSGLYGSVFAYKALQAQKRVLVLEKREHIGGNIYCTDIDGIHVHTYGAHIFHTSNKEVWGFVHKFVEFNRYTNSPVADYKGKLFNLPFNMNTFYQLWGVKTPAEAMAVIAKQREESGIREGNVQSCLLLSYNACRYDSPLIIIILMILIREYPLVDIIN